MKKQIAKRLNISLDAADWETLQRYMEVERVDQTEAVRGLLRYWEEREKHPSAYLEGYREGSLQNLYNCPYPPDTPMADDYAGGYRDGLMRDRGQNSQ
jgi:hypothetical protein